MTTKTTLPISEVRKRLFSITGEVQVPGTAYTITEKGKPRAVILSAGEYESLLETLEVMHEFPDLKENVKKARAEFKKGKYMPLDKVLLDLSKRETSVLKPYARRRATSKSSKRS